MHIFWKVWPNIYLSLLLSPALTAWFVCFHWYQQITKRQPDSSLHRSAFYYSSLSVQLGNWKSLSVPILSFSSLKEDVMRKVRENALAEIQRIPVLHDGSVPAAAVAFCAGQIADRGRQGSATASGGSGRQEWRAAKLGLAINIWCRFWRGDRNTSWTWSYTLQCVSEVSSLRRRNN